MTDLECASAVVTPQVPCRHQPARPCIAPSRKAIRLPSGVQALRQTAARRRGTCSDIAACVGTKQASSKRAAGGARVRAIVYGCKASRGLARQRTAAKRKASSVVTAICRTMPPRISMTTRHSLNRAPAPQRVRCELIRAGRTCLSHPASGTMKSYGDSPTLLAPKPASLRSPLSFFNCSCTRRTRRKRDRCSAPTSSNKTE